MAVRSVEDICFITMNTLTIPEAQEEKCAKINALPAAVFSSEENEKLHKG